MVLLQESAAELSRRLRSRRSIPIDPVAQALEKTTSQIPDDRDPRFNAGKAALKLRARALLATKEPQKDFNQLIEACLSCHQLFARGQLDDVQVLRVAAPMATPKK